jgi:hypothetical protein
LGGYDDGVSLIGPSFLDGATRSGSTWRYHRRRFLKDPNTEERENPQYLVEKPLCVCTL